MKATKVFKGIIPPVSTIFNKERKLEKNQMRRLIDFLINSGVNGLFFLGTGGEFSQMSTEERKAVAEFAIKHVDHQVPVLIGTGSTNTREAVLLSEHAQEMGADGVVVINPYYWSLSDKNLFNYYSDIAKLIDIPIILYNFPNLTGQDLTPNFVSDLANTHPNIVGIKDTVDSIGHIHEMILKVKQNNPKFSVLAGFDNHLFNTLLLGGDGSITASVNFAPHLSVGIYNAFLEGNLVEAKSLHQQLSILPSLYQLDSPFVNVVKEAMKLCGQDISTYVLPPATQLESDQIDQIQDILEQVNLISNQ